MSTTPTKRFSICLMLDQEYDIHLPPNMPGIPPRVNTLRQEGKDIHATVTSSLFWVKVEVEEDPDNPELTLMRAMHTAEAMMHPLTTIAIEHHSRMYT